MSRHVVIIGGGASGMMAAITAARNGAEVTILEHNDRIGKKLLATGNGRCNLTNLDQDVSFYRCDDWNFLTKVMEQFDAQKTIGFFSSLGIYTKNRNGYIYPNSDQAAAVLDVLRMELEKQQVRIICDTHVKAIEPKGHGFQVITDKRIYTAGACVLAAGSRAGNISGADGSGYELAKKLGHTIVPAVPALVQLKAEAKFLKFLSGVRVQATVSFYVGTELTAQDVGELQFTAYGVSGIPVFQISRFSARAFAAGKKEQYVSINFLPDFGKEFLHNFLQLRIENNSEKTGEQFFIGLLHKKIGKVILDAAKLSLHKKVCEWTEAEISKLEQCLQYFKIKISGTNSFREGQVCAGGIPLSEINSPSMESKKHQGLYLAGEIVDVDGACGGYNLQWAWSSGYAAGSSAVVAD